MAALKGKKVLLIVGAGVAAYKTLDLIRRLRERDVDVKTVLTAAAKHFVTPLSLASLSGQPVHEDLFSLTDETEMGHIELSRQADLVVVAPATADLLAKAAHGQANDLASTLLLATDKRVLAAPAMNVRMWLHPATVRNVEQLRRDGYAFVGPNDGSMACGEFGPGRMAEPMEIVAAIEQTIGPRERPLAGRRVVVTAGPTHEPIDPVRYIANRSSGKQGFAIARAAVEAGAEVVLVSGPVELTPPASVKLVRVETARQMKQAVEQALPADVLIAAAAVADWRVKSDSAEKIKKGPKGPPSLEFAENPDILSDIAHLKQGRPQLVVGFAAETQDLIANARVKLARKGADFIVANDVSPQTGVMGGDENTIFIVSPDGEEAWPTLEKNEAARRLVALIGARLREKKS